jgi:hypothetical protein
VLVRFLLPVGIFARGMVCPQLEDFGPPVERGGRWVVPALSQITGVISILFIAEEISVE